MGKFKDIDIKLQEIATDDDDYRALKILAQAYINKPKEMDTNVARVKRILGLMKKDNSKDKLMEFADYMLMAMVIYLQTEGIKEKEVK